MGVRWAMRSEGAGPVSGDRAVVLPRDGGLVIAIADGAGPANVGAGAAQRVIDAATDGDPVSALVGVDRALAGTGMRTTGIIAVVTDREIRGAGAGDSGVWLVHAQGVVDLTEHQPRTLLGDGARATPFQATLAPGVTVVAATDGLLKYARPADIARLARLELDAAAGSLVELVRLRSGALPDDVTVVVARVAP